MRGRLRVISLVGLTVAAAATAVLAPPNSDRRFEKVRSAPLVLSAEPRPAERRRAPRTHEKKRAHLPATEDLPAGTRPGRRARLDERRIRRAGGAFVAALLRLEVGADVASARRAIRGTATRQLATFVLSAPPRLPIGTDAVARRRLRAVEVLSREANRAVAQVTVRRPGAHGSVVLLELARRGERWLAAAMR